MTDERSSTDPSAPVPISEAPSDAQIVGSRPRPGRRGQDRARRGTERRRDVLRAVLVLSAIGSVGPLSAVWLYGGRWGDVSTFDYSSPWRSMVSLGAEENGDDDNDDADDDDADTSKDIDEGMGGFAQNGTTPPLSHLPPSPLPDKLPVPVYLLPRSYDKGKAGEYQHFLKDGIHRSSLLNITDDPDGAGNPWFVEVVRFKCEPLLPVVRASICRRHAKEGLEAPSIDSTASTQNCSAENYAETMTSQEVKWYREHPPSVPGWPIVLVDYTDSGYVNAFSCADKLSALLGSNEYIRIATRVHTKMRHVKSDFVSNNLNKPFEGLGIPINWAHEPRLSQIHGVPMVLRYGVRSDLVDFYERDLNGVFGYDHGSLDPAVNPGVNASNLLDLVQLPRDKDVIHFWPIGEDLAHGRHRDVISKYLLSLSETHPQWRIKAGTEGRRSRAGRNEIQRLYAKSLLQYKIVVVCQRDMWEGHYRLMEALTGGALVMTDPMQPLPLYLKDRDGLVVYSSLGDLGAKIEHYLSNPTERLKIAKRGHEIAMKYHRSWHGVERMVFGNWSKSHGVR